MQVKYNMLIIVLKSKLFKERTEKMRQNFYLKKKPRKIKFLKFLRSDQNSSEIKV